MQMKPLPNLLVLFALAIALVIGQALVARSQTPPSNSTALAWPDEWIADSAFYSVWSRADEPVAARAAVRTWLWGPAPFAVANEPYAESSTGARLVEYMDKARMEVNDPRLDRGSPWYVTSGLLVYEMVSGQVQTGNSRFEPRAPAAVPVAGDAGSPSAPTYASFSGLTGAATEARGALADRRIARDGQVTRLTGQAAPTDTRLFGLTFFDDVSKHNVPAVFREWMLQRGRVRENGRLLEAPLLDPLYVLGRPVTEAYWADVLVGGKPATVLVQLFERRALTYNPNNPPEWRVEMANVGRAYYDWRYGTTPLKPALASEVGRESVRVRGWNWPPGSAVQVEISLAGATAPLATAQGAAADAAGRFGVEFAVTPELQGALLSGGNVHVRAQAGGASAALPVGGRPGTGSVQVEGIITQLTGGAGNTGSALLEARDGQRWNLVLEAGSALLYSEATAAPAAALIPGSAVAVSGIASGGNLRVTEMRLLSVSRTGAKLGYTVQPDGRSIRVSGTGWPPERAVAFTFARLNSEAPPATQSARADSRGNLTALVQLPGGNALTGNAFWLFAVAIEGDNLLAQVALPFDPPVPGGADSLPPALYALAASGEQQGGLGSYCWRGICADTMGVPVPQDALTLKAGEAIGFRSQIGPDPNRGISPASFTARLYSYDNPPGQVANLEGRLYFTPRGQPVYSTPALPGRPFSVTLPTTLATGKYALVVSVGWPDPTGRAGDAQYGFTLSLSGRQ